MKLFSRKALVAAATAATVSLSGVTVATAETTNDDTAAVNDTTNDTNTNEDAGKDAPKSEGKNNTNTGDNGKDGNKDKDKDEESSSSSSNDSEGSSISDMSPREIRDWIAVFTAIIGALGTVFAFYNKHFAK